MKELVIVRRKIETRDVPKELVDIRRIIIHLRDIANVGHLLEGGTEGLLDKYRRRLKNIGWSDDNLFLLELIAFSRTNWEALLPHIHIRGNVNDWLRNKHRWLR